MYVSSLCKGDSGVSWNLWGIGIRDLGIKKAPDSELFSIYFFLAAAFGASAAGLVFLALRCWIIKSRIS